MLRWIRERMKRKKSQRLSSIGSNESLVRKTQSELAKRPYQALETLDEARSVRDGYVIMEGDYGGQIYLVCPARHVRCSERGLLEVLKLLDGLAWDDPDGARILYERQEQGTKIAGGMGGGLADSELWLHEGFSHIKPKILSMLSASDR